MKETPILFTSEMARAILDGSKTQTRRLVDSIVLLKKQTGAGIITNSDDERNGWQSLTQFCRYGQAGDRLWVKETHLPTSGGVYYRADFSDFDAAGHGAMYGGWKPSIFCKRIYSRITLEIARVRVERLQDITEEDAKADGSPEPTGRNGCYPAPWATAKPGPTTYRESYQRLWDSINAKKAPWKSNPWVWAITFNPK